MTCKTNNSKRRMLKGVAVGAAWSTPVVQGVVIPAHANLSTCTIEILLAATGSDYTTNGRYSLWQESNCVSSGVINSATTSVDVIPVAPGTYFFQGEITQSGGSGPYSRQISVFCCDNEEANINSSSSGAANGNNTTDIEAFVTVFENGTCETGSPDGSPPNACE